MCHKLAKIHYILVEFELLGVNSFFGKSLQIWDFSCFCDFESKINVNVILQWKAKAISLKGGTRGWEKGTAFLSSAILAMEGTLSPSVVIWTEKARDGCTSYQEFMKL